MSSKTFSSAFDNVFNQKPGTFEKIHDRARSHSVMHQLLNPKPVDSIGTPATDASAVDPASADAQAARDEETRKKLAAAQAGGYASTVLAGKSNAGGDSFGSASRVLYGS